MIEIGLCADENFAMPCGVCITSIFESNKDHKIRVHILTDGFSDESVKRFNRTAERYNQIVKIYTIDSQEIDSLPIHIDRYSVMTYARFMFPTTLSKDVTKLIYLDCDIIVAGDIVALWNTDITNYACACTPDVCANDIRVYNRLEKYDFTYVNAGVLIFNLLEWRKNNIRLKCVEFLNTYPERCLLQDQDAINAVLYNNIKHIDIKYNVTTLHINNNNDLYNQICIHKRFWQSIESARENPIIIHYATCIKPWHKEYMYPIKEHFIETLRISEWRDSKIQYKNKGVKKILYWHIIKFLKSVKSKIF